MQTLALWPSRGLRLGAALVALALLGLAALTSVRIFWAEQLAETGTEEGLRRALSLAPANASAWAQLGVQLERNGDSSAAAKALARALQLNRYDAAAWIGLGLHWEVEGDARQAEQCLLEATRVDRTFAPRWALANFYLRQGGGEPFWSAIRDGISSRRADLAAAFNLCWRASSDPAQILNRAIPDVPDINRRYAAFLMGSSRMPAMAGIWKRMAARPEIADRGLALAYLEGLLGAGQAADALAVWNRLAQAGLVPYPPLDPLQGRLLTNGKFLLAPSGRGFDWKPAEVRGVSSEAQTSNADPHLLIRLSGTHAESTELLAQLAPALEGRSYQLRFRYRTTGLPADTGLYWTVDDFTASGKLAAGEALVAGEEGWQPGKLTFRTGPRTRLIRLVFAYRRSPGTTRAQGSVSLSGVELSPAIQSAQAQP